MDLQPCAHPVQKARICWRRPAPPPVPQARGPRRAVAAVRTAPRTAPLALEPTCANSAGLRWNALSSSTKAGATPAARRASMQKMACVNPVVLLAKHVKKMPPTATPVKEASSWSKEHARKHALRGTWQWKGYASIAQRCARSASMRKHAKSAFLSPSYMRTHAMSPVPPTSTRTHADVFPATKTVWSAMAPRLTTVKAALSHPSFSMTGSVWTSVQQELTMRKRLRIAKIAPGPARPARQRGPAPPVWKARG